MTTPVVEQVQERLKKVLVTRVMPQLDPETIASDTALVNRGLNLDSVALLEFVVGIEEEFDVILDDATLTVEHFRSLGALAAFVQTVIAPA